MSISVIGGSTGGGAAAGLNRSQVFTSSGNFTVPAGVTYLHVSLRGGNGGTRRSTSTGTAADGGSTSFADQYFAAGGPGGWTQSVVNGSNMLGTGGGYPPVKLDFYVEVTPGDVKAIVVGSGTGANAVVSWTE